MVVVGLDMFMIYSSGLVMFICGLFGYVYDVWQWSVWICLLVVSLDMFISGLFGYVHDMC